MRILVISHPIFYIQLIAELKKFKEFKCVNFAKNTEEAIGYLEEENFDIIHVIDVIVIALTNSNILDAIIIANQLNRGDFKKNQEAKFLVVYETGSLIEVDNSTYLDVITKLVDEVLEVRSFLESQKTVIKKIRKLEKRKKVVS